MSKRKYQKEKFELVDLSDRSNIQIIPLKHMHQSEDDIKQFEEKLDDRYMAIRNFSDDYIKNNRDYLNDSIDEEFNKTMSEMLKQHALLKSMLEKYN